MSPFTNASTTVVGTIARMKSVTPCAPALLTYCETAFASSVAGSMFMPAPGLTRLTTNKPMTSASVLTTSKYSSVSPPTFPTALASPTPATPATTVQKMIGAIIILTSLMKASPKRPHRHACRGIEMPERHADDRRGQNLPVERAEKTFGGHGVLPDNKSIATLSTGARTFESTPESTSGSMSGSMSPVCSRRVRRRRRPAGAGRSPSTDRRSNPIASSEPGDELLIARPLGRRNALWSAP